MTCPSCKGALTLADAASGRCLRCGRPFDPSAVQLVVKTSTVRIAEGETNRVYRSLDELPPETRGKLQKALDGPDSETIVIADERGREKILQAIAHLPPGLKNRVVAAIRAPDGSLVSPAAAERLWQILLPSLALAGLLVCLFWIWRG